MKFVLSLFFLTVLSGSVIPQPPKASNGSKPSSISKKPAAKASVKKDEKTQFEKALALENAEQKAAALEKFLVDFPSNESRSQAIEALTTARVAAAQAKLESGERDAALKLLRKAVDEAPVPYPDKLFADSISKVPMLTFSIAGATAAYESAAAIEKNAGSNVQQLLFLADFYLRMENGGEAKRLAEAALKLDEKSSAAYQTLGMANRLNFDLEASAAAYEKAVELDPESVLAKQSLAEMKRAIGKPEEAVAILSPLIEKDPTDLRSINGRILALFDAGKRTEAETEFTKVTEAEPGNFILLSGAAYWYAANGENTKAIDLAGKAIVAEPRYIWAHIALARGLAGEGRFIDAEQVLLKARKHGNFPTLDYELASVKFSAGFYREAAEELQKSFVVKEGAVVTKLGRRIDRSEKNFIDLLSAERRASILQPKPADSPATAEKMQALLVFANLLGEKTVDEAAVADAAAAFADGADKMRFHRQMFAANRLAERSVAAPKVLELTKAAVVSVDDGLSVPLAAAPIMASELYASRASAIATDKYVLVPEVSKQTLSAIARGRIEELAGIALMQQKNNAEAALRFRRALSILPEKSAWWRTSHWRLGTVLEADGKDKEALDAYVKSYMSDEPDAEKYGVIESVYKRVNNGTDGLDALVGANPSKPAEKKAEATPPTAAETKTEAKAEDKANSTTGIKTEPSQEKNAELTEAKSVEVSVPPAQEKDQSKAIESPLPQPETKKVLEEKPPEKEPTPKENESRPTENTRAPIENITKTTDDQTPKSLEKEAPPAKQAEKKVENESGARSSGDGEPPIKATKVEDNKAEVKASETVAEETRTPDAKPTPKPLFEPVVIEVKSSKPAKLLGGSSGKDIDLSTGERRARVVEGKEIAGEAVPQCALTVSQNNIALTGGKGSIGILASVENGDIKEVKYSSSSPKDIDVTLDSETPGIAGKAFFVVRSLTEAAGEYKVSFTSPCGKKEVQVRVR